MRRIRKPVIQVPRTFEERLKSAAAPLSTLIIDQLLGAGRYDLVDRILKGMLEIYTPFMQQKRPSRIVEFIPLNPIAESNLPVEMEFTQEMTIEEAKRRYSDADIPETGTKP